MPFISVFLELFFCRLFEGSKALINESVFPYFFIQNSHLYTYKNMLERAVIFFILFKLLEGCFKFSTIVSALFHFLGIIFDQNLYDFFNWTKKLFVGTFCEMFKIRKNFFLKPKKRFGYVLNSLDNINGPKHPFCMIILQCWNFDILLKKV